jgi:hypothetical protein
MILYTCKDWMVSESWDHRYEGVWLFRYRTWISSVFLTSQVWTIMQSIESGRLVILELGPWVFVMKLNEDEMRKTRG